MWSRFQVLEGALDMVVKDIDLGDIVEVMLVAAGTGLSGEGGELL